MARAAPVRSAPTAAVVAGGGTSTVSSYVPISILVEAADHDLVSAGRKGAVDSGVQSIAPVVVLGEDVTATVFQYQNGIGPYSDLSDWPVSHPEPQCVMRIPASLASAPSVVCAAFKPSVKSASEKVSNKSVVWCQCGFAPLPVS